MPAGGSKSLEVFFIDDALLFSRRLGVLGQKMFTMINPNFSVCIVKILSWKMLHENMGKAAIFRQLR
jgi:hypothetical protein